MTPRTITNFRLDSELLDALREIKERDGLPISEQIRRAVQAWVEEKGVRKAPRKRVAPRKRG